MRYTLLLPLGLLALGGCVPAPTTTTYVTPATTTTTYTPATSTNCLDPAARLSTKLPTDLHGASHHHNRISHPIRDPPHLAGQIGGMADTGSLDDRPMTRARCLTHFPPHQTIYRWFTRFRDDGTWESLNHHLVMLDRERVGREASPSPR